MSYTPKHRDLHSEQAGRALHLLDLENILGGRVTPQRVTLAWQRYAEAVHLRPEDAVLVALSRATAAAAIFALPSSIRCIIGSNGRDGADAALVGAVDIRHAATRYARIYLASGDHYFIDLARQFRTLGCRVTQVVGAARVSAELYRICDAEIRLAVPQAA